MKDLERGGWEALEGGYPQAPAAHGGKDNETKCYTTNAVETFKVLNDLVVDRRPSPFVSLLELFGTCIPPIVPQTIVLTFAMQATSTT